MKISLLVGTLCTVIFMQLSAQYPARSVKQIKKSVDKIKSEQSLNIKTYTVCDRLIKIDSISYFLYNHGAPIKAFYKNEQLLRLTISDTSLFRFQTGSITVEYFFSDSQLIYVHETETNQTRMGACGEVTVGHNYYFVNRQLAQREVTNTNQWTYQCYYGKDAKYKPANQIFKELDALMWCIKN